MYRQPTRIPKSPDHGNEPYIMDIAQSAEQNQSFRAVVWTGKHLQTTLMSIPVGCDIGLEVHLTSDQFIYIESGRAKVMMGDCREKLDLQRNIAKGYVVQVPAGTWHNIVNTGSAPLKLFTIYAPPLHPKGELMATKAEAEAAERRAAKAAETHKTARSEAAHKAAMPAVKPPAQPAKPAVRQAAMPAVKPQAQAVKPAVCHASMPAAKLQAQAAKPAVCHASMPAAKPQAQTAKPAVVRPAAKPAAAECPAAKPAAERQAVKPAAAECPATKR